MFGGNFAPAGWAFCNGALLPISEYETLFALIGTTYGGDGQNTFALPDLQGRVPVHQGNGPGLSQRVIGEKSGSETVTLSLNQMPQHTHSLRASSTLATGGAPGAAVLAKTSVSGYGAAPVNVAMATAAVTSSGGSQPHQNMAPYLAVNYIVSLFGVFPSQS